jgi:hypothetical protein
MSHFVMAGLVPAVQVLRVKTRIKDVDARHTAGHDEPRQFGLGQYVSPPLQTALTAH